MWGDHEQLRSRDMTVTGVIPVRIPAMTRDLWPTPVEAAGPPSARRTTTSTSSARPSSRSDPTPRVSAARTSSWCCAGSPPCPSMSWSCTTGPTRRRSALLAGSPRYVDMAADGPFSKAAACNAGYGVTSTPAIALVDADMLVDRRSFLGCVERVLGGVDVIRPFGHLVDLDPTTSASVARRCRAVRTGPDRHDNRVGRVR